MNEEIKQLLIKKHGYKSYKFCDDLFKIFAISIKKYKRQLTIPSLLIINWLLNQPKNCPICNTSYVPYSAKTLPTITIIEDIAIISNLSQLQLICRSGSMSKTEEDNQFIELRSTESVMNQNYFAKNKRNGENYEWCFTN